MKDKLIILDMDNTILRSHIDFPLMKQQVNELLLEQGLGEYIRNTVAYTITAYQDSGQADEQLLAEIWRRVCQVEEEGMGQAVLEPGIMEALDYLQQYCELTVLTNNTEEHLYEHMQRLGLADYLSYMVGRGGVARLKPSPEGMEHICSRYPHIDRSHILAIGDATIDAQAAAAAGLLFAAYNSSREEDWEHSQFRPLLYLKRWDQEACRAILRLWDS